MASEVKTDKLSPSGGTALQIGDASDTITIPTGATFTITDGLGVAGGGTGLVSFTAGDVLYATGSTTLAKLAKGTAEEILSMNSGATAPEWTTAAATAGGTGQTGFTAGDILYANSTTTLTKLGKGTARQGLQTNSGATAPEWVNSPQSLMTAEGDILYASGANTLAKLAKGSDDQVLTLASGVPSWAAASGGITTASSWRLTADSNNQSASYLTSNWEAVDAPAGFGALGSAMTESSGIFTFPSTGYWYISFQAYLDDTNGGDAIITCGIYTTIDDASYSLASIGTGVAVNYDSGYGGLGGFSYIFDVTDTANCKVQFGTVYNPYGSIEGNTNTTESGANFIKLADT